MRVKVACGGGGRGCSRCTTAANIFIFKRSTEDNQNLTKSKVNFISILTQECRKEVNYACIIITPINNTSSFYYCRKNWKVTVSVVRNITLEKFTSKLRTIISIKESTNYVFKMISPASTCMGTIHKYYEKIKDAVEDPKP